MKKPVVFFISVFFAGAILFAGCAGVKKTTEIEDASVGKEVAPAPEKKVEAIKPVEAERKVEEAKKTEPSIPPAPAEIKKVDKAIEEIKEEIKDAFFDFDRYSIRESDRETLKTNARLLNHDKNTKILIQGHADERGTVEYNIALGERRAKEVRDYLVNLGVSPARISTITYGEEKPFCRESNEDCWQLNRRAHFVLTR